jgi:hypothetical protein
VSQPSEEQLRVITKWVGIFMEHHHKEISELGMAAYIEGLCDLRPNQIERACALALKEVDRMPTVAHIRDRTFEGVVQSERPSYLDAPATSEEDVTEGLYFSQKLKARLAEMEDEEAIAQPVMTFAQVTSPQFNINHEAYLLWLEQEEAKDEQARKEGLEPPPRSKEERLAMFYNLPLSERRRLRRKAEWTKKPISGM